MEVVHHLYGEDDFISRMPDNVIANIMDRLPLKDAVATSILSTSWRLKWTFLTQLILDYYFFASLRRPFNKIDISRLLLHVQVTKFHLAITNDIKLDDADIYHWILFLSRIPGFEELTLLNLLETPAKLPTHLFSCLDLKHLELYNCVLSLPSYFHGFPKLVTLEMHKVRIRDHQYGKLIAQCPLLETLRIKNLDLSLCLLDNKTMVRLSTVLQHMSLIPKLQELFLDFENCEVLPEDVAQTAVSCTFPFLKTLTLCLMDFSSVSMLSCAFGMIFGCTNLQNLSIYAIYKNVVPLPAIFPPEVDRNIMGQLHLQKVELAFVKGLENEVCLIKYILACSPMLERFEIKLDSSISSNDNEKYNLASKLLKLHRASPIAEVVIF